jgi:hypothetical protein
MNRSFKIEEGKKTINTNKNLTKILKILLAVFGLFLLFVISMLGFGKIFVNLFILFVFITLIIIVLSYSKESDLTNSYILTINDKAIIKTIDREKLSGLTSLSASYNNSKSGVELDCIIPYSKINYTSINQNKITIESDFYDIFNGNGKIIIPKEIEDYDTILDFIKQNKTKFKLI